MKNNRGGLLCAAVAGLCLALAVPSPARAQGRGGGGPPPGGGGMGGGMNGGMAGPPGVSRQGGMPPMQRGQDGQPAESTARVGLQFGPPGRWWDDRGFAKNLKLRPDQQTRMDGIFEQNRGALLSRFESLQQAETQLDQLSNSPAPDEGALFTQIDRVAQARAELEKANTHMLLQLRKEMDADQIKRLQNRR